MLTKEPTPEMLREWKKIFNENHKFMKPNRKTGIDVDNYFRSKYQFTILDSQKYTEIVASNIFKNEFNNEKLPEGLQPIINTYMVDDIFVGIELITGFFHVECEIIEKMVQVYDDLFAYRGLDDKDLQNYYLVAQYIKLTNK